MPKKVAKDVAKLTGANVTVGAGTLVLGGIQSKAPGINVTQGMSSMAGFMPIVGTTVMAKNTLRLAKYKKSKKLKVKQNDKHTKNVRKAK